MEHDMKKETGSEIIQLAFAIPVLIVLFGLCAQACIWASTAIQFANAADYVASEIDIETLDESGIGTTKSEQVIADAIASSMVGVDAKSLEVSNVALDGTAESSTAGTGGASSEGDATEYYLYESKRLGKLTFTASCTAPCIINIVDGPVFEGTWRRDRLIEKVSEVRYDLE